MLFYIGFVTPFFQEIIRCIFVTNHPLHRACVCAGECIPVTALHLSAGRGHLDIVALLLERPEIQVNRGATTPLHLAVYGKNPSNIDVVKLLLKHPKMDVNKASKVGITPLYTASQHGHVLMVQALLAAGAEKNTTNDKGFTPLNAACFYGHTDVVRLLVDAGSNTELGENNGFTPILNAACKGYLVLRFIFFIFFALFLA